LEDFQAETLPEPVEQKKTRPAWVSFLLETVQTILMAVVLYFLIDSVVARVRVENISMEPTLFPGEFLLVNKLSYRLGSVNQGDIIVFHYPQNPQEDYIKRVIGLPGDVITIGNNRVMVNEQLLNEKYIAAEPLYNGKWQVPEGSLFVLGDNRNQSSDSHSWGFVPMQNVVGKALVIYWPINQMKVLTQPIVVNAAN
jgi:signal peptidase I